MLSTVSTVWFQICLTRFPRVFSSFKKREDLTRGGGLCPPSGWPEGWTWQCCRRRSRIPRLCPLPPHWGTCPRRGRELRLSSLKTMGITGWRVSPRSINHPISPTEYCRKMLNFRSKVWAMRGSKSSCPTQKVPSTWHGWSIGPTILVILALNRKLVSKEK